MKKFRIFAIFAIFALALCAQAINAQTTFDPSLVEIANIKTEFGVFEVDYPKIAFKGKGGVMTYKVDTSLVNIPFEGLVPTGDFTYSLALPKKAIERGLKSVNIKRIASFEEALFEMEWVDWYTTMEGLKCGMGTETKLLKVEASSATFRCPENGCADAGIVTVTKTASGWKVTLPDGSQLDGVVRGSRLVTPDNIRFAPSGGRMKTLSKP